MKTNILPIINGISKIAKNIQLNLSIEGWPAVVAITAICGTYIAVTAIKEKHSPKTENTPQEQTQKNNTNEPTKQVTKQERVNESAPAIT